jgi:hypothetical protein
MGGFLVMGTSSNLILNQVIALIEPLTRFDRSSVQLRDESEQTLNLTGVWTSTIEFSSNTSDGKGKLPSGVRNASSQARMEREISDVLSAESAHVIGRIRKWCGAQGQSPPSSHKPLSKDVCFSGVTRIGYAWNCSGCKGRGTITCSACNGHCQVTCSQCYGEGRTSCSSCGGRGRKTCGLCNGQAVLYVQESKQVYNWETKQYSILYEHKPRQCHACQGGTVNCGACYSGKVDCWVCHGSGKINCPTCGGTGQLTCQACGGTGALHRIGETACQVTNDFTIRTTGANFEVGQTIARWDFPVFCELTSVKSNPPVVTPSRLIRDYPAMLQVMQASLHCAEQDLLLYGFGTEAKVFDFKGIVGHLLANDLHQLESLLKLPWSFLPFRNQSALRESLSTMLESELNQQLCDKQRKNVLVANGTVTEQHATRTVKYLRKAMGRLYRSIASLGLLAVVAVVFLTLESLHHFGYMLPQNPFIPLGILVAAVVAAPIAAEFTSPYLVLKEFSRSGNAERPRAASRLLRSTGTLWRWRIGAAIGFFEMITR